MWRFVALAFAWYDDDRRCRLPTNNPETGEIELTACAAEWPEALAWVSSPGEHRGGLAAPAAPSHSGTAAPGGALASVAFHSRMPRAAPESMKMARMTQEGGVCTNTRVRCHALLRSVLA